MSGNLCDMESRTPRPKRKSVKRKYEYDDSENNRISETQFTKVNLNTRINYCNNITILIMYFN